MMLLLFIVSTAYGAEPPDLPEKLEASESQCIKSYAFEESVPIPKGVIDGQVAACSGVLIPTSDVADLVNYRTYSESLRELYRLDTQQLESEMAVLKAQNDALNQPVPWIKTPKGQRWVGRVEVAAVVSSVLISAYYINKAVER